MVGNRPVLERILESGGIFMAWSDRPWTLDGAAVRVSIIGFDNGSEKQRTLDGSTVEAINADLTSSANVASAKALEENANFCFLGVMKGGPFDIMNIAAAARELVSKRDAWLNPPGATEEELKKRTLTNLYNANPSWLAEIHRRLDEAVFAAYGWTNDLTDAEIVERILALNRVRSAATETA
jgi:hypothetical protein